MRKCFERDVRIIILVLNGTTFKTVGDKIGVSIPRVIEIIQEK